ncbi:MAG: tetratricopeptide repeat protein [Waddliaceae bacterium]|nr:tetratricopeptide repeat protein [Waddliaceae bacterium]
MSGQIPSDNVYRQDGTPSNSVSGSGSVYSQPLQQVPVLNVIRKQLSAEHVQRHEHHQQAQEERKASIIKKARWTQIAAPITGTIASSVAGITALAVGVGLVTASILTPVGWTVLGAVGLGALPVGGLTGLIAARINYVQAGKPKERKEEILEPTKKGWKISLKIVVAAVIAAALVITAGEIKREVQERKKVPRLRKSPPPRRNTGGGYSSGLIDGYLLFGGGGSRRYDRPQQQNTYYNIVVEGNYPSPSAPNIVEEGSSLEPLALPPEAIGEQQIDLIECDFIVEKGKWEDAKQGLLGTINIESQPKRRLEKQEGIYATAKEYKRQGKFKEAAKILESLVQNNPREAGEYKAELAALYLKMKKYDVAAPLFKEAIEAMGDRHDDHAIIGLARCLYKTKGKETAARRILEYGYSRAAVEQYHKNAGKIIPAGGIQIPDEIVAAYKAAWDELKMEEYFATQGSE